MRDVSDFDAGGAVLWRWAEHFDSVRVMIKRLKFEIFAIWNLRTACATFRRHELLLSRKDGYLCLSGAGECQITLGN